MTEEIKEILYYFEKYHFEDTMIDGKETKLLYDCIIDLQNQLQQKENIIKEVREYIENKVMSSNEIIDGLKKIEVKGLLKILDKEKV